MLLISHPLTHPLDVSRRCLASCIEATVFGELLGRSARGARRRRLRQARERAEHVYVADDPSSDVAHWMQAVARMGEERGWRRSASIPTTKRHHMVFARRRSRPKAARRRRSALARSSAAALTAQKTDRYKHDDDDAQCPRSVSEA
jgi:hypothetical protein